jgi:hypothetical protein
MKLGDWLEARELRPADFAPRINRTAEAVRRYVVGERIPDRETMPLIVRETGGEVTANDFFDLPTACPADGDVVPVPHGSGVAHVVG